jgi:hypothetical protein
MNWNFHSSLPFGFAANPFSTKEHVNEAKGSTIEGITGSFDFSARFIDPKLSPFACLLSQTVIYLL